MYSRQLSFLLFIAHLVFIEKQDEIIGSEIKIGATKGIKPISIHVAKSDQYDVDTRSKWKN